MNIALQHASAWSAHPVEDARFRRILLQVLAFCTVLGIVVPYISLPTPGKDPVADETSRLVRVIVPPRVPAPAPPVRETVRSGTPAPDKAADSSKVPATKTPGIERKRPRAENTGVLAMSDALREMSRFEPRQAQASRLDTVPSSTGRRAPGATRLSENVSRGSGGIDAGVSDRSLLGQVQLPTLHREDYPDRGGELSSAAGLDPASRHDTPGRSQTDIQEVLDRHKNAIYVTYNRALRKQPELRGKLILLVTIAESGLVLDCKINSSELESRSLENQILELVRGIDFGARPGAGTVRTRVPMEFFPQ